MTVHAVNDDHCATIHSLEFVRDHIHFWTLPVGQDIPTADLVFDANKEEEGMLTRLDRPAGAATTQGRWLKIDHHAGLGLAIDAQGHTKSNKEEREKNSDEKSRRHIYQ